MKKRLFSAVQPSGKLHIGNYIGAIRNFVALQNKYESFFSIVNYHAITVPFDPDKLQEGTVNVAKTYLACGIDPAKSTVFVQSDVSAHTELAWIFNAHTYMGELNRMTQFKEKSAKQRVVGAGLFNYPTLMAADILLYDPDVVPVGEDQKQHVELTRNLAERFNKKYGQMFAVPEPLIRKGEEGSRIMSLSDPTKKMSKSDTDEYAAIYLTDGEKTIRKKIARATTDSVGKVKFDPTVQPGVSNLLIIMSAFSGKSVHQLEARYKTNGYADFKNAAADTVVAGLKPIQKNLADLDSKTVDRVLTQGALKAKTIADKKLKEIKKKIGVI